MAQLSREDFMSRINQRLGDDNSQEAIGFMTDMVDTFDGLTRTADSMVARSEFDQLQGRYDELSRNFRERFLSGNPLPAPELDPPPVDEAEQRAKNLKFGDLFTKK